MAWTWSYQRTCNGLVFLSAEVALETTSQDVWRMPSMPPRICGTSLGRYGCMHLMGYMHGTFRVNSGLHAGRYVAALLPLILPKVGCKLPGPLLQVATKRGRVPASFCVKGETPLRPASVSGCDAEWATVLCHHRIQYSVPSLFDEPDSWMKFENALPIDNRCLYVMTGMILSTKLGIEK